MIFNNLEQSVQNAYEKAVSEEKSWEHIIQVFTENYATPNKNYNRSNDTDMLLYQYGCYDWGDGKNLEIDFARQLMKGDDIVQVHITVRFPYEEKFKDIHSGEEWFNSAKSEISVQDWGKKILRLPLISDLAIENAEVEVWTDNAE